MAARFKIIVLDKPDVNNPNLFHFIMWADVPAARQVFFANASAVSLWKDAITADNLALQSGAVVEKSDTIQVSPGQGIASVEQAVQDRWTAFQDVITNGNRWVRYGSTWDGTTWVLTGVA